MPTNREAQGEVERLTPAQRAAILRAEPDGKLGHYFIRQWLANARTLRSLCKRGMATRVWSGVMLSPTGLAVRQALQTQEPDHG